MEAPPNVSYRLRCVRSCAVCRVYVACHVSMLVVRFVLYVLLHCVMRLMCRLSSVGCCMLCVVACLLFGDRPIFLQSSVRFSVFFCSVRVAFFRTFCPTSRLGTPRGTMESPWASKWKRSFGASRQNKHPGRPQAPSGDPQEGPGTPLGRPADTFF